jgi:hypothetical protein
MTTRKNTRQHTAASIISAAWENYMVRLTVLGLAFGVVPFYFLSLAVASLGA